MTLTSLSAADGVTLDTLSGAVSVAAGTAIGSHSLSCRICENTDASNCDDATVSVNVHAPLVIDAANDSAVSFPGGAVIASVLSNDTLDGGAAAGRVTLSAVSSTNSGVTLDTNYGTVYVADGTAAGTYTLTYRICESASPSNCDAADATITDQGVSDRRGGRFRVRAAHGRHRGCQRALQRHVRQRRGRPLVADPAHTARLDESGSRAQPGERRRDRGGRHTGRHADAALPAVRERDVVELRHRDGHRHGTHLPLFAASYSVKASSKNASTALPSVLANDQLQRRARDPGERAAVTGLGVAGQQHDHARPQGRVG